MSDSIQLLAANTVKYVLDYINSCVGKSLSINQVQ